MHGWSAIQMLICVFHQLDSLFSPLPKITFIISVSNTYWPAVSLWHIPAAHNHGCLPLSIRRDLLAPFFIHCGTKAPGRQRESLKHRMQSSYYSSENSESNQRRCLYGRYLTRCVWSKHLFGGKRREKINVRYEKKIHFQYFLLISPTAGDPTFILALLCLCRANLSVKSSVFVTENKKKMQIVPGESSTWSCGERK